MDGNSRRKKIIELLRETDREISGSGLAAKLSVSRQVIVQDIALLRTEYPILATARGYLLDGGQGQKKRRVYLVKHSEDQIPEELYIFVDAGGRVLNTVIEHDVYGQIKADLILTSRREVDLFCEALKKSLSGPLSHLSDGVHMHTVEADSEEVLDYIGEKLKEKGFLLEDEPTSGK